LWRHWQVTVEFAYFSHQLALPKGIIEIAFLSICFSLWLNGFSFPITGQNRIPISEPSLIKLPHEDDS